MQREEKGKNIATHRLIERKGQLWEVPSQSGKGKYTVEMARPSCTCPDFALRGLKCKHIYAVEYTLTPATEAWRAVSKTKRPTYRQDWPAYHAAQTHEKAHFQALLHGLCQGIKQPVQNRGRHRLPWSEIVFSAGFKVYSTVSTRRFMSELVQASAYGYISSVPHYNSILASFQSPDLTPLLHDLIGESSLCLKSVEVDFAVDSSGFSTSRPLRWYNARYGHEQENHDWMKIHLIRVSAISNKDASRLSVFLNKGAWRDIPFSLQMRLLGKWLTPGWNITSVLREMVYLIRGYKDDWEIHCDEAYRSPNWQI